MAKYQTISEFMHSPFGESANPADRVKFEHDYQRIQGDFQIKIMGYSQVESSYYIHLKIPSESKKDAKYGYDVVIRFFTDNPDLEKEETLSKYYLQFFSNCPSFIFQYAVLCKQKGYLIEELFNKLEKKYQNKLPEKANPNMKLTWDRSLYCAVRFLSRNKFKILSKHGNVLMMKKKPLERLVSGITDFESVKLDQSLISSERKLKQTLEQEKKKKDLRNGTKKRTPSSTQTKGITRVHATGRKPKQTARKTTVHK